MATSKQMISLPAAQVFQSRLGALAFQELQHSGNVALLPGILRQAQG